MFYKSALENHNLQRGNGNLTRFSNDPNMAGSSLPQVSDKEVVLQDTRNYTPADPEGPRGELS